MNDNYNRRPDTNYWTFLNWRFVLVVTICWFSSSGLQAAPPPTDKEIIDLLKQIETPPPMRGRTNPALETLVTERRVVFSNLLAVVTNKEHNEQIRTGAIITISVIAYRFPEDVNRNAAAKVLTDSLDENSQFLRLMAVQSLGAVGSPAAIAVPQLAAFVENTNQSHGLRLSALYSLGSIGSGAKDALPAIQKALKDPDPYIRSTASEAVTKIK
jgi:hypothetical protein